MKQFLALLMAALLLLTSVFAFAEGTPPKKPSGEPPAMPSGGMGAPPDGAPGGPGGFGGGTPPGGRTASFEYAAATEITAAEEQANQTYASAAADESALIVHTADDVTIENPLQKAETPTAGTTVTSTA